MTALTSPEISLQDFLARLETKPASEYINGAIYQKPMPKGKHSRLQLKLCNQINATTEANQIAYAFPELRCSFGDRSIVPDIAVFQWSRIPLEVDGEVPDNFLLCPDWTIEILSPEQSPNRVTGNILYCLEHGCQLGWLVDPGDRSILIFQPNQQPRLFTQRDVLTVLPNISLSLTATEVFSWLKMGS
ncbi:Uma2 family endonuclease [Picosynechococcus sp. NKBG15041c]|uniref:Uma2 family endonuclease n=1 Tax=Picosynechococcus sp. NKBG15041c TaxID=1407650 RepID=UPI000464F66F|nr:Uma2 family endonuclease [Picosynechococcus sp. NKBG15041c]